MDVQRIDDVTAIRDAVAIPGLGVLPINAFVLHADQPVLVDTGRPVAKGEFLDALGTAIDVADLRWIWITHPDRDHMGSLFDVLEAAPKAKLVSTFMAVGYLTVEFDMPFDRVHLVNPGESLDVGDRTLHAFRPPLFDSPMTVGFHDSLTGTCFSSDCFGAPMVDMDTAGVADIGEVAPDAVRAAQLMWASADSPWVATADRTKFAASYTDLRRRAPELVLSTHLPPARGRFDALLGMLDQAPDIEPMVGPTQQELETMLAGMIPEQPVAVDLTEPESVRH